MSQSQKIGEQNTLYRGLSKAALESLELRSYQVSDLNERLASSGVEVGQLLAHEESLENWIPGVELFQRRVFRQRHRGHFGELARLNEGDAGRIGLKPIQWASALMYAGTAKGFHIHPPHIPDGYSAADWFLKVFVEEPERYEAREYEKEQWDMMFFVKGNVEFFLVDERAGMPRRKMRFTIDGDHCPSPNNAGLIIPPGVAHGLRVEGSEDLVMVYGTSTTFDPEFEGRIASGVERAELPPEWESYFASI